MKFKVTIRAYLLRIRYDWFCASLKLAFYWYAIAGYQSQPVIVYPKWLPGNVVEKTHLESQLNKIAGYLRLTSCEATSLVHDILDQVIKRCDEPQLKSMQIIVNEVNRKYKI